MSFLDLCCISPCNRIQRKHYIDGNPFMLKNPVLSFVLAIAALSAHADAPLNTSLSLDRVQALGMSAIEAEVARSSRRSARGKTRCCVHPDLLVWRMMGPKKFVWNLKPMSCSDRCRPFAMTESCAPGRDDVG